jgi:hypothetical protein
MCGGPGGSQRVAGGSGVRAVLAAGLAALLAACGTSEQAAEGADLDRPLAPSLDAVEFVDVANDVGLGVERSPFTWGVSPDPMAMMAGGLCWIDYDADGWLDLFVTDTWSEGEWGRWRAEQAIPTSRLFRNEAGRFVDVTETAGAGVQNRSNGCVAADLDLDGWSDLYVTTERENVLLWNEGGERFVDDAELAAESGAGSYGWQSGAAVGDVDGNGWPDLFVAGYTDLDFPKTESHRPGFPNPFVAEPDLLLLNDGPSADGTRATFRDVADQVGIEPNGPDYGLGVMLSDLDGDGDLDVYVANDTTPNQLYEQDEAPGEPGFRFIERGGEAGVADEGAGMGVAVGDADGDGRVDLVTTNQLKERHVLVRNVSTDALAFVDARAEAGVPDLGAGETGWGTAWADVDLDGDLDLLIANGAVPVTDVESDREPIALLENRLVDDGTLALRDASETVGLDAVGPFLARGLAAADYDNDGDVDLAVGTIGGELALLRNTGAGGHWLTVAFPVPAPGAVVTIRTADGTQRRELAAGSSYLSSEDPRAHFGLGALERVETVEVRFPDGRTIRVDDVEADRLLELDPRDAA